MVKKCGVFCSPWQNCLVSSVHGGKKMWCLLFTLAKIAWCLLGLVSFVLHSQWLIKLRNMIIIYKSRDTAVTMQLICTFVFATQILQYLFNIKSLTIFCGRTAWFCGTRSNPKERFSCDTVHMRLALAFCAF